MVARLVAEQLAPLLRAESERLLDRPLLADRLGVAERTVACMVARGELPPPLLHTPGIARWRWAEVIRYLESRQGRARRQGRGRYERHK
jgi:predicted DNA-binding transcriptional regulator AlpA